MDLLSVILLILIAGVVIYFITKPFNRQASKEIPNSNLEVSDPRQIEYQKILSNLKDLDFEYKLGKVTEAECTRLKTEYQMQAAELLTVKKK